MKKLHLLGLIILSTLTFAGCKGKYCYGFPDELTVYLPYSSGENLCFVDNHQDTIILNVQNLDKTRPEYLEWGCKCGCEYYYNVGFKYSNDTMFDVFLWTPDMTEEEMTLRLLQYRDVDYTNGQRNGDSVVFAYSEEFNRENEYAFFDSIVIVKGEGIISFNTLDGQVHHKYHHINTLTQSAMDYINIFIKSISVDNTNNMLSQTVSTSIYTRTICNG